MNASLAITSVKIKIFRLCGSLPPPHERGCGGGMGGGRSGVTSTLCWSAKSYLSPGPGYVKEIRAKPFFLYISHRGLEYKGWLVGESALECGGTPELETGRCGEGVEDGAESGMR